MNIILIIILVVIFACWFYKQFIKKDVIEGLNLNTFTGRLAIDDQYFYDQLFDDVFYYPNEPDKETSRWISSTGWIKCKMECPGHCVEYGPTGNAYCFPY